MNEEVIRITHYVSMTDRFMSGWGKAGNKKNKLVISCCSHDEAVIVAENANNRSEMENVETHNYEPVFNADKYTLSYGGRGEEDEYKYWFIKGQFASEKPKSNAQIEKDKRNFTNIAKIFTKPTGAITETLHGKAIDERMIRFMRLQNSGLTAKQIEDFTFKLTDAEKISILSRASNKAPLSRELTEEMQRLFLKVYGEEAYNKIFDAPPPEKPEWFEPWGNK